MGVSGEVHTPALVNMDVQISLPGIEPRLSSNRLGSHYKMTIAIRQRRYTVTQARAPIGMASISTNRTK
jgi:hypothetical protein